MKTPEGLFLPEEASRVDNPKPPRFEKLATNRLLLATEAKAMSSSEEVVRLALDPYTLAQDVAERDALYPWALMLAVARTGTLFVLPQYDYERVVEWLHDDQGGAADEYAARPTERVSRMPEEHPYDFLDLPPLPFPRMIVEIVSEEGRPYPFWWSRHHSGERVRHDVLLVNETVPHEWWDIVSPGFGDNDEVRMHHVRVGARGRFLEPLRTSGPGDVLNLDFHTEETHPNIAAFWRRLVLDVISMVTAENVPHDEMAVPRQHRRSMERQMTARSRMPFRFPTLYWVRLDQGGEGPEEGRTDRQYHVRWMVRGHWRLSDSGTHRPAEKGFKPSVWVKPYVKGPAGAPWKGRPVYVKRGEA